MADTTTTTSTVDESTTTSTTLDESTTTTTTVDEGELQTSRNLEGGPDATDALGMKKNVVGPNHDDLPADNSPTTNDVTDDAAENIENARNEGFSAGLREQEQAKVEPEAHPYDTKNLV